MSRFNPQPFQMYLTDANFSNEMAQDFSVTPGVFNLTRYGAERRVAVERAVFSLSAPSQMKLEGFGRGTSLTSPLLYNPITENGGDVTLPISTNIELMDLATDLSSLSLQGGAAYYHIIGTFRDGKPIINFSTGGNLIITINDNLTTRALSFKCFIYGYYID